MGDFQDKNEAPEGNGGDRKALFSELSQLFSSIAKLITEDARAEQRMEGSQALKSGREISHLKKTTGELLSNTQAIATNLQLFKEQLIQDFGSSSYAFINKSIDPMIQHASKIIQELYSKGDCRDNFPVMYEKALQSVEFYSQFNDERKLRRKIITEAIQGTKQAIEKDCQILKHYTQHSIEERKIDSKDALVEALDKKLAPIFQEFFKLEDAEIDTSDLREFFIWKSYVDERRNALTELGLLTIESLLAAKGLSADSGAKDFDERGEHSTLSVIEKSILDATDQLTALTSLEERVLKLFERLESKEIFSERAIREIETLFSDLNFETKNFEEIAAGNSEFTIAFEGIMDCIKRAEALFNEKRKLTVLDDSQESEFFS